MDYWVTNYWWYYLKTTVRAAYIFLVIYNKNILFYIAILVFVLSGKKYKQTLALKSK